MLKSEVWNSGQRAGQAGRGEWIISRQLPLLVSRTVNGRIILVYTSERHSLAL